MFPPKPFFHLQNLTLVICPLHHLRKVGEILLFFLFACNNSVGPCVLYTFGLILCGLIQWEFTISSTPPCDTWRARIGWKAKRRFIGLQPPLPPPRRVALTFTPLTFLPQLLSVTLTLMHLVLFALVSLSFSPIKPFVFVLAWCFLLHHG